jgi:hypothetical protein
VKNVGVPTPEERLAAIVMSSRWMTRVLGLDDLLAGVWRHNPTRVDVPFSRARLARQQPATASAA